MRQNFSHIVTTMQDSYFSFLAILDINVAVFLLEKQIQTGNRRFTPSHNSDIVALETLFGLTVMYQVHLLLGLYGTGNPSLATMPVSVTRWPPHRKLGLRVDWKKKKNSAQLRAGIATVL